MKLTADFEVIQPGAFGIRHDRMTITKHGIRFSSGIANLTNYPTHAVLYLNKNTKQLIIMPAASEVAGARKFYKKDAKMKSPFYANKGMLRTICSLGNMDVSKHSYSIQPEKVEGHKTAVGFDLTKGVIFK